MTKPVDKLIRILEQAARHLTAYGEPGLTLGEAAKREATR